MYKFSLLGLLPHPIFWIWPHCHKLCLSDMLALYAWWPIVCHTLPWSSFIRLGSNINRTPPVPALGISLGARQSCDNSITLPWYISWWSEVIYRAVPGAHGLGVRDGKGAEFFFSTRSRAVSVVAGGMTHSQVVETVKVSRRTLTWPGGSLPAVI